MSNRRSQLILVGLIALALVGVLALAIPGSPVHKKVTLGLDLQGGLEVVLKAVPPKGKTCDSACMERSISIMRSRIDKLGVAEPEIRKQGKDQIVIQLAGVHDAGKAAQIIGKTAQLQFYDLETDVTGPSNNGAGGVVAFPSLYNLLSQVQIDAKKGTPTAFYLFNSKTKRLVAGPEDTRAKLLDTPRFRGKVPKGFTVLAVPPKMTVVSCQTATGCPGVTNATTAATVYYLFKFDPEGNPPVPEATGGDLKLSDISADISTSGQGNVVRLGFTGEGAKKFHEITRNEAIRGSAAASAAGQGGSNDLNTITQYAQHFAIVLDGELKSTPYIDYKQNPDGIDPTGTGAEISNITSFGEAKDLALVLQTGALPVKFEQIERTDVSATLGKDSLKEAKTAALIGLLLVAVFLLVLYRFLGVVAVIGLGIYAAFLYAAILLFNVTLTLPGFAGLILTIGVAADANVVVFERIKEEVRAGKSVRAAISAGYAKGFHTIIDANVVTVITALVLFAVATAGVKGFALMLMIGTVISLVTAVAATRAMLGLLAGFRWFENPRFMGAAGQQSGRWLQIDFMKRRYLWFAISGAIVAISIGALAVKGLNLGIDFKGGTQVTFVTDKPVSLSEVRTQASKFATEPVVQGRGASVRGDQYKSFQLRLRHAGPGQDDGALERHQGAVRAEHQIPDPDRLGELRAADRALGDHRDPLLAAPDHPLHRDQVRLQVRGAGDHRVAARHRDHRRRLCADREGGVELDRCSGADRARVLDLRHDHHLRPHTREHPAHAAGAVRDDRERLALGDDPPLAGDNLHHAAADRRAADLRRCDAAGLRLRPDGGHPLGRVLVDLHRGAPPDHLEGARAGVRAADRPGARAECRRRGRSS